MQLSEEDGKELKRLSDEIDAITQKLRTFIQKRGHLVVIHMSKEYQTLQERLEKLEEEFNSIPKTNHD